MTTINLIETFTNFKDKNIKCLNKVESIVYKGRQAKVVHGYLDTPLASCPKCYHDNHGPKDMIKNGTKLSMILCGRLDFEQVWLKLKKQRYLCRHCLHSTIASTPEVNPHCFISNKVRHMVAVEMASEKSLTTIAKDHQLSVSTVIRVLETFGKTINDFTRHLPEHLAIDEFKSVKSAKHAMSCILMDNFNHTLIDILPGRTQADLTHYFLAFPLEERLNVKTVTMDMYSPYISLFPTLFPNADIILDRFHIVQLLNKALNRQRIHLMNQLKYKRPTDYKKLKDLWKLILKKEDDLNGIDYRSHRLFDGLMSESSIVDYLLSLDSRFELTHRFIHRLIRAIDTRDFEMFKAELEETRKYTFAHSTRTCFKTLDTLLPLIKNSLFYTLSNGFVEGSINKIKNIKRSGYGYRNYRHLKYRILMTYHFTSANKNELNRPLTFWEEEAAKKYNKEKTSVEACKVA